MKIYWYAPFDNACETSIARYLCRAGDQLTFHSLSSRFGRSLPLEDWDIRSVRNLPEPAGESGGRATIMGRAKVAVLRAGARHELIRSNGFDLLHLHTFNRFTDWAALPVLPRCRSPVILSVHNVMPHDLRCPEELERLLHQQGYSSVDHMVVAHELLRNQLVTEFGVPGDRVTVLPLAVPIVVRTQALPGQSPKDVLFFGTLRANKGIPVLLDAIARVPRNLGARFRFAGRGDPSLEAMVQAAAKHDDRIVAEIGWVSPERRTELYSGAWSVILPYTAFAAQSGVLREAYAFGVPVIVSDIGALGRAVRDEDTGWIVAPGSVEALAQAIASVLQDDIRRKAISSTEQALARTRTPEVTATRLRDLYDHVTARFAAMTGR